MTPRIVKSGLLGTSGGGPQEVPRTPSRDPQGTTLQEKVGTWRPILGGPREGVPRRSPGGSPGGPQEVPRRVPRRSPGGGPQEGPKSRKSASGGHFQGGGAQEAKSGPTTGESRDLEDPNRPPGGVIFEDFEDSGRFPGFWGSPGGPREGVPRRSQIDPREDQK